MLKILNDQCLVTYLLAEGNAIATELGEVLTVAESEIIVRATKVALGAVDYLQCWQRLKPLVEAVVDAQLTWIPCDVLLELIAPNLQCGAHVPTS